LGRGLGKIHTSSPDMRRGGTLPIWPRRLPPAFVSGEPDSSSSGRFRDSSPRQTGRIGDVERSALHQRILHKRIFRERLWFVSVSLSQRLAPVMDQVKDAFARKSHRCRHPWWQADPPRPVRDKNAANQTVLIHLDPQLKSRTRCIINLILAFRTTWR